MKLANNFVEFLLALNAFEADYIIVGGYAVIFHGYPRTTGDLDIWLKPAHENKAKVADALKMLKFNEKLCDYIYKIDFTKPFAVKLGEEPLQIDIFNAITGVRYDEAEKKCISYPFSDELEICFLHLDDLFVNKMLTGRLKDKADVEELQKVNRYRNRK